MAELREANQRLKMKVQSDVTDGRRGETTIVKSSQVSVQSIPDRPKQVVQESITSSKKRQMSLEDHDVHRVLEDVHKEPLNTGPGHGRDSGSRDDPYGRITTDTKTSHGRTTYGQNTRDSSTRGGETPYGEKNQETISASSNVPYRKQTSEEEYRIEDIEAELESLRDDLARTREIRGKSNVKYVSEDVTRPPARTRTVSGGRRVEPGQGSGGEGKRMVITTASYARVPRQDSKEFKRQGSEDKKVSKLIEMFSKPTLDQNRNSHKRANSGDKLARGNRGQRARSERPKSAIEFEAWERVLNKSNGWD